jgi:hypothetical protein
MSIFAIIFLAFLFALNNLFMYYQKPVRSLVQVSDVQGTVVAEKFFGT